MAGLAVRQNPPQHKTWREDPKRRLQEGERRYKRRRRPTQGSRSASRISPLHKGIDVENDASKEVRGTGRRPHHPPKGWARLSPTPPIPVHNGSCNKARTEGCMKKMLKPALKLKKPVKPKR
ncbi:hypothetical protein U9M48_025489 [Paspalum notatum var. saurae]|uniref:Uncharacterized protein n=1 Tax=Paspalum notatum var. saurae TaxID=547442 RepID=A0AAQ3TQU4_PASNO